MKSGSCLYFCWLLVFLTLSTVQMHGTNCSMIALRDRGLNKSSCRCKKLHLTLLPLLFYWKCLLELHVIIPISCLTFLRPFLLLQTQLMTPKSAKEAWWPETFPDHLSFSHRTHFLKVYTLANLVLFFFFNFLFLVFRPLGTFYSLSQQFPTFFI